MPTTYSQQQNDLSAKTVSIFGTVFNITYNSIFGNTLKWVVAENRSSLLTFNVN